MNTEQPAGSYSQFEHTADVGVDIRAASLPDLFATACRAFAELTAGADAPGAAACSRTIEADGIDLSDLLVSFLSELLFLFDARGLLFQQADSIVVSVDSDAASIRADCSGRRFDRDSESALTVIKAVTHHGAIVERTPDGGWAARVLFDT